MPIDTYLAPRAYLLVVARKDNNSSVGISTSPPDATSFESGWGNNNGTWDSSDGDTPVVELAPPSGAGYNFGLNFFSNVENDGTPRESNVDRGDTVIIYDVNLNPVCLTYFPDADSAAGDSIPAFVSLEKSDPTILQRDWSYTDATQGDSVILQGTPGRLNTSVSSSDLDKLRVKDNPFATVGELWRVKGETEMGASDWQILYQMKTDDGSDTYILIRLPDRFTVSQKRLEAESASYKEITLNWDYKHTDPYNNEIDATHPDTPFLTPYYSTSSSDEGTWAWGLKERISPDTSVYDLYILGLKDAPFEVSVNTWNEDFDEPNWVYLIPGPDGIAHYGEVIVGDSDAEHDLSDTYLQVTIKKPAGYSGSTYFDGVVLAPLPRIYGRINVNTADTEVLHALPNIDAPLRNVIVNGRPYNTIGEIWDRFRTYFGDGVTASRYFSRISNLITTRGKLFRIEVTGRYIRDTNRNGSYDEGEDEVLGEYKITTIYER